MKKETKVTGIWSKVKFVCGKFVKDGEHSVPCGHDLDIELRHEVPFMVCPVCGQSFPYTDAEKMVQRISDEIVDNAMTDTESDFTNEKFSVKKSDGTHTDFRVLKDRAGSLVISAVKLP